MAVSVAISTAQQMGEVRVGTSLSRKMVLNTYTSTAGRSRSEWCKYVVIKEKREGRQSGVATRVGESARGTTIPLWCRHHLCEAGA